MKRPRASAGSPPQRAREARRDICPMSDSAFEEPDGRQRCPQSRELEGDAETSVMTPTIGQVDQPSIPGASISGWPCWRPLCFLSRPLRFIVLSYLRSSASTETIAARADTNGSGEQIQSRSLAKGLQRNMDDEILSQGPARVLERAK